MQIEIIKAKDIKKGDILLDSFNHISRPAKVTIKKRINKNCIYIISETMHDRDGDSVIQRSRDDFYNGQEVIRLIK